MGRRDFHIGPGAASLLLVAVVVCMSILGLLASLDARSNARLTDRSTAIITAQYDGSAQAERDFAALDLLVVQARAAAGEDAEAFTAALQASLPGGMELSGSYVSWRVTVNGTSSIWCIAEVKNTAGTGRLTWVTRAFESAVGEEIDDEW